MRVMPKYKMAKIRKPLVKRPWYGKRRIAAAPNLDLPESLGYKEQGITFFGDKMPGKSTGIASDFNCNLVTSLLPNGRHAVTLDFDYPTKVLKSRTKGHTHFYADPQKSLTWKQYKRLLKMLADVGLIEKGYAKASIAQGFSALRRPTEGLPF